ncbi:alpha/beta fold hydrolase [Phytoactinopolyspora halotolerans]|uniref:Alpha/beta hydrolase n=1 Tax=Phytoactinopolyspora halotolerans TaxID=1981512 RepID=A0A6L9SJF8_9ACTN|nr:alpha/beta hydrolase [Phytoactinopolyspora halotolerans]NEE04431.1 alpha/beta hydrolase [Phytoactinopolyspora halotolerans]
MYTTTSNDGTTIAYDRTGDGPPVILVDGALCHRAFGPAAPLAKQLADRYTVYTYDRRGRGDSTDTPPYAVEREIEDIEALIKEAGGSAFLYGISSGAALAIEAANRGIGVTRLATYEAPYLVDETAPPEPADYRERLEANIAAGKRSDAVRLFMKLVGTPGFAVVMMRMMPVWKKLKAVAHTLPYDHEILKVGRHRRPLPADRWTSVTMPTLVMAGGKSPDWMRNAQTSLADVLPNAEYRTLEGQTHLLKPEAVAPVLKGFFTSSP